PHLVHSDVPAYRHRTDGPNRLRRADIPHPHWPELWPAVSNVFRNVPIAHPTIRRLHFLCDRRHFGRRVCSYNCPVSSEPNRLGWHRRNLLDDHGTHFRDRRIFDPRTIMCTTDSTRIIGCRKNTATSLNTDQTNGQDTPSMLPKESLGPSGFLTTATSQSLE